MPQSISEFIFFKVRPEVRPEDPHSEEGEALLNIFRSTKQQSGHQNSAWGRTVEDEDVIVWVVDWTDARGSTTAINLEPFLAPTAQPPTALYTTLSPPISSTDTLTANPVTEICALPFPSSLTVQETKQLNAELINFRTALVEHLPQEDGPRSWAMGHIDRPNMVQHAKSPSGHAVVHLLAVGWETVEAHKQAKETEQFQQSVAPIREKMLPPVPGLEMKHVSFQKI
ncbi:hypothetical protein N7532_008624 [Penicillium argentinense]|uniref:ABM domain-containing protein n=1 Tax=Penicillium argentinense TaxID=1131581 RepID=A0A9W9K224_9EURO|nr:uncharacterized protein N7532_008624 [Penicillium argentinense]KAJ5089940.1 hypothetical protein N7532_008624 [Penicillium argentinense]